MQSLNLSASAVWIVLMFRLFRDGQSERSSLSGAYANAVVEASSTADGAQPRLLIATDGPSVPSNGK